MACAAAILLIYAGVALAGMPIESESALRFRGTRLLYGERGLERLRASHVAVVGLGGVGSWAAEALARTGVGTVTLADLDDVCVSNTNRQVHGLSSLVGQPKAEVIASRLLDINPDMQCHQVLDWVTPASVKQFIEQCDPPLDALVDAVGLVADKAGIIDACARARLLVVTCGAPLAKSDSTAIRALDLACSGANDPTLAEVVRVLKEDYSWPELTTSAGGRDQPASAPMDMDEARGEYGVIAVTSIEPPAADAPADPAESFRGDSLGTAAHVTGGFGFAAAGLIASVLADPNDERHDGWQPYENLLARLPTSVQAVGP